jgi:hypothetical protein
VSGVRDIVKAFAVFSAVYAIAEIAGKQKTLAEAKRQHETNLARLDNIDRGIEAIRAKLR